MASRELREGETPQRFGPLLWGAHLVVPLLAIGLALPWPDYPAPAVTRVGTCLVGGGGLWLTVGILLPLGARGRRWIRRRGTHVFVSATTLVLLLALAEAGMRVVRRNDVRVRTRPTIRGARFDHPTRGWAGVPGREWLSKSSEFEVLVVHNSRGLRDVEHELAAAPGVFRVVVLGDSFMEAAEVELEESMPRRLERELSGRNVEVVNLGVRAYGTAQELLSLEEEGLAYGPDLVVLAFYVGNDLRNNHRDLETSTFRTANPYVIYRPYASLESTTGELSWYLPGDREPVAPVGHGLILVRQLIGRARRGRDRSLDTNMLVGPYALEYDLSQGFGWLDAEDYVRLYAESWDLTTRLILELRDRTEEAGAELVVLAIPTLYSVSEEFLARTPIGSARIDPRLPSRRLAEIAERNGLHLLDLFEPLQAAHARGEGPCYHPVDRHWNAAGHELGARLLREYLVDHGLVPERS